ncbi:MAG: hypothetical protein UR52_C0017G0019 [Candidatus Gottesmanbacteria bacterium GW2011_GWA1_34_13]|uniref:ChsH2 C-terminal OB-fold domain-containing protein n=1 Tax=Candidatus Gottesmanbacteria bacterium GW2011_GWA1_34_13 TaxID=1618434 RepID=A0A0G0ANX3_9BACT|nr:MAG: hypothetical protein UR52_C0017G0019 [Candidatus Gottesmanbacteria bacterium GW2011_GWA1_34_13]
MFSPIKIWRNQKYIKELLGKKGEIISYTIVRIAPQGFESQAPYPVVLVRIGNKNHIGQLVDANETEIKIGQKVIAVVRRIRNPHPEGIIPYGIKFKLLSNKE